MDSSEKILNNYDVLQLIFRYLDFKAHLKLIKICPQFEDAIVHGVWRLMYKGLCILYQYGFYLEYNGVKRDALSRKEFLGFLQHSSMYIRKLALKNYRRLDLIILINRFKYQNLTELTIWNIVVEDSHLQQVAKNCINLESLTLLNLMGSTYKFGSIRPQVFGEMKALNKLEIRDVYFDAWNYSDVQQLFCLAHLKTLIINIKIRHIKYNNGSNNNSTERVYNIENLTIQTLPYLQSANACFVKDLIRFENLTKLSLTLKAVSIDNNVLTQMNNGCPKLCELSLTGCDFSCNEFPRMNNLKHLELSCCKDIKLKNFDEIFRNLKLKSLSLTDVQMADEAEDISNYNYISNTLETLNIKYELDDDVVITFFNRQHKFENVSKVRLQNTYIFGKGSEQLCFSHNFPNLKELIMNTFHISSEDILHLKHLKVLQFKLFDNMSWSYLEMLFKHPTLTHITIKPINLEDLKGFEMLYEYLPNCCEGLTTTLEYLSLPFVVYKKSLNFWTCFHQRNKLLKLEVIDY